MDDPKSPSPIAKRGWLRSLRPLFWWLLLVIVLFAYHTHERLSEKTRLRFWAEIDGTRVDYQASATLDGVNISSGQKIKLGHHEFAVSHPKAHPFSTNLFIWYGEHDLGAIALERIRGALELQLVPPAKSVSVHGGEFSAVLTNSGGITSSVPTDIYEFKVHWANYDERRQLNITASGVSIRLAPELGALTLGSDPSGAAVVSQDGRILGSTPLALHELPVGLWKGELQLAGYIPVPIALMLVSNQTNSFLTNLVNWRYSQAMDSARTSFAAGDLDQTLLAAGAALKAQPNDSAALELQQKATIKQHLRNAEALLAVGDYGKARLEAEAVLKFAPDNASASALLKEISTRAKTKQQREKDEAYAQRQKRLILVKQNFEAVLGPHMEAPLFAEHELDAALPAEEALIAIYREFLKAPAFNLVRPELPGSGSFAIVGAQEVPGGLRRCMLAGTQIATNETRILFKVMEYKTKTVVGFQGSLTFTKGFTPLDTSRPEALSEKERIQLKQGAVLIEERIRRAVSVEAL